MNKQKIKAGHETQARLLARPVGIDTYQEAVIYMRSDCAVCRSEGFESQSRVKVSGNGREFVATLNVVQANMLDHGEAGLSDIGWSLLDADAPCPVAVSHPEPVESFRHVRRKLYGHELDQPKLTAIVGDVVARRYSDVQTSAFLAACVGDRMTRSEVVALTRAMVDAGERLEWDHPRVFDKHCVGGLPGNRTTPIIVAIVTAFGIVMPKTSSRAITSPAGTADTMETITRVDLSLDEIRRVVDSCHGCMVWGGAVNLSPADDVLIRVERALDVDSEAQLIASVLSKKIAAGSTHTIIDIPVGPTAKVRSTEAASHLSELFRFVGDNLGILVDVVVTDGTQPVGKGIGPALEAADVLKVLRGDISAPEDLRRRATLLAGRILELAGEVPAGSGDAAAQSAIEDGRAYRQFAAICEAQGDFVEPPRARYTHEVSTQAPGTVTRIDNRRLAKVAKLAGAPTSPAAGIEMSVRIGDHVESGEPLFVLHADAPGELDYALDYLAGHPDIVQAESEGSRAGND